MVDNGRKKTVRPELLEVGGQTDSPQLFNHLFYILAALTVTDQNSVRSRYDHHVMNANRSNHSLVSVNNAAGGIYRNMSGSIDTDRPVIIRLNHLRQSAPAPDITPPHLDRQHQDIL